MKRLEIHDGSWQYIIDQWQSHAFSLDEELDLDKYSSLNILKSICKEACCDPYSGVFSLANGEYVCLISATALKGYDGKVARVRHINLHPKYDFSKEDAREEYISSLTTMYLDIIRVSATMRCKYLKIHFNSPAEIQIFKKFSANEGIKSAHESIDMIGAWLYVVLD